MKRPVVAALLSALAFPGVGQWYLRRPRRAALFGVLALLSFGYVGGHAYTLAMNVVDLINAGKLALDPDAIAAYMAADGPPDPWMGMATTLAIGCWVFSIVDALFVHGDQEG